MVTKRFTPLFAAYLAMRRANGVGSQVWICRAAWRRAR
jgi:hypothetical protein